MNDMQRYLVDEFCEDYQHGRLSRREALRRIAGVVGSLAAASSILAACAPPAQPAPTAQPTAAPAAKPSPGATTPPAPTVQPGVRVSPDDPAIEARKVEFPGQGATLQGYLAKPKGDGPFAAVLVCHENRGLVDHIQDVARRFARAGYVALAVDLLSREGGTDKIADQAQVPGLLGNAPADRLVQDFQSGLRYLQGQPSVRKDRMGMVGFCFGGGVTWQVATHTPELRAAVPFYGPTPPPQEVPNVQAAVLAFYGERDQRINQGIPAIEAAMKQNNKTFEKMIYPDADHAFFNDTGPRYNPEASRDAWSRTLAWFEKYLRG
ncbi:MAG: dienelactone hydrolase family protein [Chloroflexi bacterium]|nr:dienelactone hydrolase family protein [Chloroflexota bacterium]